MSPDLEDRLRRLNLAAPEDLKSGALRKAQEDHPARSRTEWLQIASALVLVILVVAVVLNVAAHPDHTVFSNISSGLGT